MKQAVGIITQGGGLPQLILDLGPADASFVVPAGRTVGSVECIGGGWAGFVVEDFAYGGAGGGNRYAPAVSFTPGETIEAIVRDSIVGGTDSGAQPTYTGLKRSGAFFIRARDAYGITPGDAGSGEGAGFSGGNAGNDTFGGGAGGRTGAAANGDVGSGGAKGPGSAINGDGGTNVSPNGKNYGGGGMAGSGSGAPGRIRVTFPATT